MANSKYKIGCKYQFYDKFSENDRTLYRLIRLENKGQSIIFKKCGTDEELIKTPEQVDNTAVEIQPDALLHIMWTKYENGDDDMYVRVFRTDTLNPEKLDDSLAVIMRQDCVSQVKAMFGASMKVYVGECLTKDIIFNQEVSMTDLYDFDHVEADMLIYLYCDDTLDDVMKLVGKTAKIFDDVFKGLSKKNSDIVIGYATSLAEFLEENGFIDAFRSIFGIVPIDFPIILGKESYDSDDNIILNKKQHSRLEDILRKHIKDVKIIDYDYDLDIRQIVNYPHIMVSDLQEKIYLITYNVIDDYPVDDDIAAAMKH